MKVKALKSFVGKVSMNINEIKEISNKDIIKDLVKSKYVELIEEPKNIETKNVSQETKPKTKTKIKK